MRTCSCKAFTVSCAILALSNIGVGAGNNGTTQPQPDRRHLELSTTDQRTQNIRIDQIWRVRSSFVEGEPRGRTVVDFAFSRLFVRDSVDEVVKKIAQFKAVAKFTAPNGSTTYVVIEKIVDVQKALRHQHHPKSKAIISTREGEQQVRESEASVLKIIEQAK